MSDPKNKWTRPGAPPAPMFFGEKERNLVKQVNDELAERVLGQTIAYYPISIEESNFNDIYGEAKEKVSLPPVRVFAYVEVQNDQTNTKYGYEYQTKLTVNFHRRRLVEDQNLFVRVGDYVQYGEVFYEIVKTYNDTRYYFGQVEHKFQVSAECVKAREGAFRVIPGIDRPTLRQQEETDVSQPAPRPAPYPPLDATYITVNSEVKLPNERRLTAGTGITLTDNGPNNTLTIDAAGANAVGPTGSIQFQEGAGVFTGSANLTFLPSSGRLGINTDTPTHSLTIIGDMSASSDVFIGGDLTVQGVVIGGSPLKVSGSIHIVDASGVTTSVLGSSSLGTNVLESTLALTSYMSASFINIASASAGTGATTSSYLALDANNNVILTSSIGSGGGTPGGSSTQIQFNNAGAFSASANLTYNGTNLALTGGLILSGGLTHNRTSVATSYTASTTDYILAVTNVPTSILFNATDFSAGQTLVVKDESGQASSATSVILNPSGSQTIDGAPAIYLESPYGSVFLYTDGSDWFIY